MGFHPTQALFCARRIFFSRRKMGPHSPSNLSQSIALAQCLARFGPILRSRRDRRRRSSSDLQDLPWEPMSLWAMRLPPFPWIADGIASNCAMVDTERAQIQASCMTGLARPSHCVENPRAHGNFTVRLRFAGKPDRGSPRPVGLASRAAVTDIRHDHCAPRSR